MKIICPEHNGLIYVDTVDADSENLTIKNLVIECPVCEDEVLIDGEFSFDAEVLGYLKN